MKPETADRDDLHNPETGDGESAGSHDGRAPVVTVVGWPADDELPVAPTADVEERSDEQATELLRQLTNFHLYGRRADGGVDEAMPIPALLHPYRDLSRIRYEYPVCLDGFDPDTCARPLGDIVDDVLAGAATEGDEGEQMKRSLYRLESVMRSVTAREPGRRLSVVWERAATSLRSTSELRGKKQDLQREQLKAAREALVADGELLPCSGGTALRLFTRLAVAHWRDRVRGSNNDVKALIQDLKDILITDFQHSAEARSPERLGESLAADTGGVDAAAMSEILEQAPHADPLPKKRRDRIEKALAVLERVQPAFEATAADDNGAPFAVDRVMGDCAEAAREYGERLTLMVDFFKAVRLARLEASNGYRESVHDSFFKKFNAHHMTTEEQAQIPPVLLHLTRDTLDGGGMAALVDMLGSGMPVKVLWLLDDLCGSDGTKDEASATTSWAARLAGMVMGLGGAYALQAPLSRFSVVRSGLLAGFRYDGPALFSIYTAERQAPEGFPAYLAAAAATESRIFPVFEFDPGAGPTLAERMHVSENPQSESDWAASTLRYLTANGEEQTEDLTFTPADFLCLDPRLARYFWPVVAEQWHDDMAPLGDCLAMEPGEAAPKIPYILAVDDAGVLVRVVVTRELVSEAARTRAFWYTVRESGGINNSFANNLLAAEKQRLDEEMQKEIEAVEEHYASLLEQDVGELTREIVQRIANRLMGEPGDGSFTMAAPATVAPAPQVETASTEPTVAEAPAEEKAPVVEEDEDIGGMDDAYIDTPLCTTCNECTQLNAQIFAYNADKQAYVNDPAGGPYQDIVRAAELCPVHIIHPGKPKQGDVPEEWIKRAAPYN